MPRPMDAQTIIAKRIAQELSEGMLVNLGIGIPTLVSKFVPTGMTVYFQSENGPPKACIIPCSPTREESR